MKKESIGKMHLTRYIGDFFDDRVLRVQEKMKDCSTMQKYSTEGDKYCVRIFKYVSEVNNHEVNAITNAELCTKIEDTQSKFYRSRLDGWSSVPGVHQYMCFSIESHKLPHTCGFEVQEHTRLTRSAE